MKATRIHQRYHDDCCEDVLYRIRHMEWGCDTRLYADPAQLRRGLPISLAPGKARVLKQSRGNGGDGVWKVEPVGTDGPARTATPLRVRQAKRGSSEEMMTRKAFCARCASCFAGQGRMIDQAYQERLPSSPRRPPAPTSPQGLHEFPIGFQYAFGLSSGVAPQTAGRR